MQPPLKVGVHTIGWSSQERRVSLDVDHMIIKVKIKL
jgi:hypothetical protein